MAVRKRTTKKSKAEAAPPPERPLISGPEYRDGLMYLSERDLATYELARTRYEAAIMLGENLVHRIEKERRETNDRINAMRTDQFTQAKVLEQLRAEVVLIKDAIEAKYGVDLLNTTYDDKTGKIFENQANIMGGG